MGIAYHQTSMWLMFTANVSRVGNSRESSFYALFLWLCFDVCVRVHGLTCVVEHQGLSVTFASSRCRLYLLRSLLGSGQCLPFLFPFLTLCILMLSKSTHTAPLVDELDHNGAVCHRQEPVFNVGHSPCPHTRTLDTMAMLPHAAPVCSIMVSTHSRQFAHKLVTR